MKIIETNGISYLEHLADCSEWYCGTDFSSGELYEAEEIFLSGTTIKPNRLVFVHHPDGKVYEPIKLKENQYFGRPTEVDNKVYILMVDFGKQMIHITECTDSFEQLTTILELPLTNVDDCYNLLLRGTPLMLTRQDRENNFEVIWPEKLTFQIDSNEAFLYRKDGKLVFSRWIEDPEYREEVVIRDTEGNVVEVISGNIFITPGGEEWVIR